MEQRYDHGHVVTSKVQPAHIELVLTLDDAQRHDRHLPPIARGWRTLEQLRKNKKLHIAEASLRKYVSLINRGFKNAAKTQGFSQIPPVIEFAEGFGYRLGFDFDRRIRRDAAEEPPLDKPTILLNSEQRGGGFLSVPAAILEDLRT